MDREYLATGIGSVTAELREQLSMMTAASQLLERTASGREKEYLASLNRNICCMLRTVNRMELAHRLTDENEIRAFPAPMELGPWTVDLAQRVRDILAPIGVSVEWTAPASLLLNGDEFLLNHMVLEMIGAALSGGNHISLSVSRRDDNVHLSITAGGDAPESLRLPEGMGDEEEPFGVTMSRQIAQLHGGALVVCLNGGRFSSLTAILPQRMNLTAGRLESPRVNSGCGGFDPVLVAFSHLLPGDLFLPEDN